MEQQPGSETYSATKVTETLPKETYTSLEDPEVKPGPDSIPWLDSVEPNTLEAPGPDTTVIFTGGNFFEKHSMLVWNGVPEPATYIDFNHASTIVKPSTVQAPLPFTLQVWGQNGRGAESNRLDFTFTAPP